MNKLLKVVLAILLLLVSRETVVQASTAGVVFPELYPTINSNTRLQLLDDSIMNKLKQDIENIDKSRNAEDYYRAAEENWISLPGYYLGYQIPSFGTGKTPVSFGMITPYSALRYAYWKADSSFSLPNPSLIDEIKQYQNVAYIIVYSLAKVQNDGAFNGAMRFKSVSVKKGASIYPALPKEKFLPKPIKYMANADILWPFPADIFSDDGEPIEIQATDEKGGLRKWVIPQKQFNLLK